MQMILLTSELFTVIIYRSIYSELLLQSWQTAGEARPTQKEQKKVLMCKKMEMMDPWQLQIERVRKQEMTVSLAWFFDEPEKPYVTRVDAIKEHGGFFKVNGSHMTIMEGRERTFWGKYRAVW